VLPAKRTGVSVAGQLRDRPSCSYIEISNSLPPPPRISVAPPAAWMRQMTMEERDGYMDIVLKTHPNLSNAVEVLRREHDEFREELGLVLYRLKRVSPKDQTCLTRLCDIMTEFLEKLDAHNKNEGDIFYEAFEREEGGEG
jgi:iron-sulfur cluster repair protein YtfE (RIC family)